MWYIRYWINGKEYRKVAGQYRREAEIKLAEALREVGRRPTPRLRSEKKIEGVEGILTIYFVRAEKGLIKIGITNDIKKRFGTLQAISPIKLTLLATLSGGLAKEHLLHERFGSLRAHGEWFHPGEKLLQFIEELTVSSTGALPGNSVLLIS